MRAEWWISEAGQLNLSISYQQPNETSSGTAGCSTGWWRPVETSIEEAAQKIIAVVKETWNWREVKDLDSWKLLIPKEV